MTCTRRAFLWAGAALAYDATDQPGEKITVSHDRRLLLEYRYSTSRPKPYVHPLCLPDGRPVTLDSPVDHVHHRGLMIAWSKLNGIDFWGEVNPGPHGQIVHRRFERRDTKPPVIIVAINHWVADGKLLVEERRTLRVPAPPPEGVWLEWTSELRAAGAPVSVSAEGHPYNGLGIRFVHSMDGGKVLNAAGTVTIEKANGEPAAWCTYSGALEPSGTGGVAIFDHPSNPRHPSPFFVMNRPFGYLSAAPTFRKPIPLAAGESLRLRWGVLSYLGEPQPDGLRRVFDRFARSKEEK